MGVWGPGLFSDDDALDIRDEYVDLIGEGVSSRQATRRLVERWSESLANNVVPAFWLALAATQHKCGRLEPDVKSIALQIIDSGSDLQRWEHEPRLLRQRKAVLYRLRKTLTSPEPPPKRIKRPFKENIEWAPGDAISYRLKSGKSAILRVLGKYIDSGGTFPRVELCHWIGDTLPSSATIERLPYKEFNSPNDGVPLTQFVLVRRKEKDLPKERVKVVARNLNLTQPAFSSIGYSNVIYWTDLDRLLNTIFENAR
jgi:hypothetical protein